MRAFVTGATGFIGSALVADLIAQGHQVLGLARSPRAAEALRKAGAEPHMGSLRDLESLRRGAAAADAVAHLAFTFSPMDMPRARMLSVFFGGAPNHLMPRMMRAIGATDRAGINALGAALEGSGRPLVTTFGVMGLAGAPGERAAAPAKETDPFNPRSPGSGRAENEEAVRSWAQRGVRASIVRLAPSVHGADDRGLVPMIAAAARKRRSACYVGGGENLWCGVHRRDAATLFRLALEKGNAGAVYHGVGDEGLPFRRIAQIMGDKLGLPVASVTLQEARRRLGWLAPFAAVDNPATSSLTQEELGWTPLGPSLEQDLNSSDYFSPRSAG